MRKSWCGEVVWKMGEIIWRIIAVWHRYPKSSWEEVKKILQENIMKERQHEERMVIFQQAFPSGHTKILGAYTRYQNAKRFGTRMQRAKRLLLEVALADKVGIFRDFEAFRREFVSDLERIVVERAYKRVARGEDDPGIIKLDLDVIPEGRTWLGIDLQEKYRQALEEARRKRER